jgi:trehalose 6-phosphate synthase
MADRLVVVSNRVPLAANVPFDTAASKSPVAEDPAGVLWFGWSGRLSADKSPKPVGPRGICGRVQFMAIDLTEGDYDGYLNGFASGTLWPLLHDLADRVRFHADDLIAYRAANAAYAAGLAKLLRPSDRIWIQDYHLIPVAALLRQAGFSNPIGLFLHVPFPAPQGLLGWPWHKKMASDFSAYDLVGFQSSQDESNFEKFMRNSALRFATGSRAAGPHAMPATGVFPVGINTRLHMATASAADVAGRSERLSRCMKDRQIIISVDRLDYTKGLLERLRAYEALLSDSPEYRCTSTMVQVTSPSRMLVPGYLELRMEQQALVDRVNSRFMTHGWMPVLDIYAKLPPRSLSALYRLGRAALATPLRDGVNLAAKEYVASQSPRDPGALILSRFAGAAELLSEALLVDPRDQGQMTAAMRTALAMPLDERQDRWRRMVVKLLHHDAVQWHHAYVAALIRAHKAAAPSVAPRIFAEPLRARPVRSITKRSVAAAQVPPLRAARASGLRPGLA